MSRDVLAERAAIDAAVAGRTLCGLFAETVERRAHEDALRWREDGAWKALTWGEYGDQVRAVTLGLLGLGFGPGEKGLILARNVPEHLVADLGIVHAGGTAISAYTSLAPDQVEYVANHSQASVAFAEDTDFLEKLLAVRGRLSHLRRVVLVRGESPLVDGWVVPWGDLLAAGAGAAEREPGAFEESWRRLRPEDLAALIYTSGTTGPPKGVMYTHRNLLWTLQSGWTHLEVSGPQRMVSYLPLAHVAERYLTHWGNIYLGGTVHLCPDQADLVPTLLEARPTVFVGVPRVWEKFQAAILAGAAAEADPGRRRVVTDAVAAGGRLAAMLQAGEQPPPELVAAVERAQPVFGALRTKLGLDQCRLAITSTAPLGLDVQEFFAGIGLPLDEVWGMSELTGPATAVPPSGWRMGTVGTALRGAEIRLAADGEILVRGGLVTPGYFRAPEQTAEAIDADGWLHSGDVATVDADGYYRIVDRKKELIITAGGKNISPSNLESLIRHHPLVGQAVAVGDARRYITALIVLDVQMAPAWARARGIAAASLAELASHPEVVAEVRRGLEEVNRSLSRVEQVKRFTILPMEWTVESEELTPTLKVKRRVVDRRYSPEIEAMYAEPPRGHPVLEAVAAG